MADTQILAALRRVRLARNAAGDAVSPKLTPKAQLLAKKVYDALDALEEQLVSEQLNDNLAPLTADAKALSGLVAQMKKSDKELQTIADVVQAAASIVGALAGILGQVVEHGLV